MALKFHNITTPVAGTVTTPATGGRTVVLRNGMPLVSFRNGSEPTPLTTFQKISPEKCDENKLAIKGYSNRQKDWIDAVLQKTLAEDFLAELSADPALNLQGYDKDKADLRLAVVCSSAFYFNDSLHKNALKVPRMPSDLDLKYMVRGKGCITKPFLNSWWETVIHTCNVLKDKGYETVNRGTLIEKDSRSREVFLKKHFSYEEITAILQRPAIREYLQKYGKTPEKLLENLNGSGRSIYQEIQVLSGYSMICPGDENPSGSQYVLHDDNKEKHSKSVYAADVNDILSYKLARILSPLTVRKRMRDMVDVYNIITQEPPVYDEKHITPLLNTLVSVYHNIFSKQPFFSRRNIEITPENKEQLHRIIKEDPFILIDATPELAEDMLKTVHQFISTHLEKGMKQGNRFSALIKLHGIEQDNREVILEKAVNAFLSGDEYKDMLKAYPNIRESIIYSDMLAEKHSLSR